MSEGVWWANRQLAHTAAKQREEERAEAEREMLAEHARQFRDRLELRLKGDNGEIPIWGSKNVDLAAFAADLDIIAAGLIEEGKGTRAAPEAVWRDELIALVDDTYSALDAHHDSRESQQHRKQTITLLLNFLGIPAVKHLGSMLRDSRRRRVAPGVGRLKPPLRIVGET